MRSDSLMQRKCIVEVKPFSNCVRYSQIKGFGAFRIVNLYLYVTDLFQAQSYKQREKSHVIASKPKGPLHLPSSAVRAHKSKTRFSRLINTLDKVSTPEGAVF